MSTNRENATNVPNSLNVPTAAHLANGGRSAAYAEIRASGTVAGVPVIRVGHGIRVPTRALAERLGMTLEEVAAYLDDEPRESAA